jgi:hypothetical protein
MSDAITSAVEVTGRRRPDVRPTTPGGARCVAVQVAFEKANFETSFFTSRLKG